MINMMFEKSEYHFRLLLFSWDSQCYSQMDFYPPFLPLSLKENLPEGHDKTIALTYCQADMPTLAGISIIYSRFPICPCDNYFGNLGEWNRVSMNKIMSNEKYGTMSIANVVGINILYY